MAAGRSWRRSARAVGARGAQHAAPLCCRLADTLAALPAALRSTGRPLAQAPPGLGCRKTARRRQLRQRRLAWLQRAEVPNSDVVCFEDHDLPRFELHNGQTEEKDKELIKNKCCLHAVEDNRPNPKLRRHCGA